MSPAARVGVHRHATDGKPLKRLMSMSRSGTGLKPGVNERTRSFASVLVGMSTSKTWVFVEPLTARSSVLHTMMRGFALSPAQTEYRVTRVMKVIVEPSGVVYILSLTPALSRAHDGDTRAVSTASSHRPHTFTFFHAQRAHSSFDGHDDSGRN